MLYFDESRTAHSLHLFADDTAESLHVQRKTTTVLQVQQHTHNRAGSSCVIQAQALLLLPSHHPCQPQCGRHHLRRRRKQAPAQQLPQPGLLQVYMTVLASDWQRNCCLTPSPPPSDRCTDTDAAHVPDAKAEARRMHDSQSRTHTDSRISVIGTPAAHAHPSGLQIWWQCVQQSEEARPQPMRQPSGGSLRAVGRLKQQRQQVGWLLLCLVRRSSCRCVCCWPRCSDLRGCSSGGAITTPAAWSVSRWRWGCVCL